MVFCMKRFHSLMARIGRALLHYHATYTHPSEGINEATGGVITCIAKAWCQNFNAVNSEVLAGGRVLLVQVTDGERTTSLWNVHNFGLSSTEMGLVEKMVALDLRSAEAKPLNHVVLLGGDFNLAHHGCYSFTPGKGSGAGSFSQQQSGQHRKQWEDS